MERTAYSFQQTHQRREVALKNAANRRRIDLTISLPESDEPWLYIREGNSYTGTFFARIPEPSKLLIEEMDIPKTPMEIINYDQFAHEDIGERLTQIGKYLPHFISELYPKAKGLPINVYMNYECLKRQKPLIKVKYEGTLVTVDIDKSRLKPADTR